MGELQASLDAYLGEQLGFDELRSQWIRTLAASPEICGSAVRLLYQQQSEQSLSADQALVLKRIVEAAFRGGPEDATLEFESSATTAPLRPTARTPASKSKSKTRINPQFRLGPGDILQDRFVLGAELGRGGIGVVFMAFDRSSPSTRDTPDRVAVKVLRPDYQADEKLCAALEAEARHAPMLVHPNIVRIFDFYKECETRFLIMELVEGETLRSLMSRFQPGVPPRRESMNIVDGMCRGLAHAHQCGITHGDFKPGNVIVTRGDVPRILDFGLAPGATTEKRPNDVKLLDKAGSPPRAMTPAYASCRHLEGGTPGFPDDVYSLSCVIYELLQGRHPYDKQSALAARELDLQPARIEGLSEHQWRTLATGLKPAEEDRTVTVRNLQNAFDIMPPIRPLRIPEERAIPVSSDSRSKGRAILYATLSICAAVVLLYIFGPLDNIESIRSLLPAQGEPVIAPVRVEEPVSAVEEATSLPAADTEFSAETESIEAVAAVRVEEEAPVAETAGAVVAADEIDTAELADAAGFSLDAAEYFVNESATALSATIRRQGDLSRPTRVEWRTISDSAEPDLDYADLGPVVVNFAAGESSQTLFIPIVSDTLDEGYEYFRIALRQLDDSTIPDKPYAAIVTIIDDDG